MKYFLGSFGTGGGHVDPVLIPNGMRGGSQRGDIKKGSDSSGMFISPLPLTADFTLSLFYLPRRQIRCLEAQQPSSNHEDKSQGLSMLEEEGTGRLADPRN